MLGPSQVTFQRTNMWQGRTVQQQSRVYFNDWESAVPRSSPASSTAVVRPTLRQVVQTSLNTSCSGCATERGGRVHDLLCPWRSACGPVSSSEWTAGQVAAGSACADRKACVPGIKVGKHVAALHMLSVLCCASCSQVRAF